MQVVRHDQIEPGGELLGGLAGGEHGGGQVETEVFLGEDEVGTVGGEGVGQEGDGVDGQLGLGVVQTLPVGGPVVGQLDVVVAACLVVEDV